MSLSPNSHRRAAIGNPNELLRDLVEALDRAYISSWQSTAEWQKQLDAAREYVNAMKEVA